MEYFLCQLCNQEILQSNQTLHELYCAQNIKKCSICDIAFDFNNQEDHLNYHLKHTCQNCKIFQKDLAHHKCLQCKYCSQFFQQEKLDNHLEQCKLIETRCLLCGALFKRMFLELHQPFCQEQQEKGKFKCVYCQENFNNELSLTNHQQICEDNKKLCPYCNLTLMTNTKDEHIKNCESRTDPCSFCKKRILLKHMQDHELNCFQQQKNIPQNQIENHQPTQVQCKDITDEDFDEHIKVNELDF